MPSTGSGAPLQRTVDGHEVTLQVNHLGHFLLVQLLLPALTAAPAGRVVVVSSELHRKAAATAAATAAGAAGGPPLASAEWLTRLSAPPAPSAPDTDAAAAAAAKYRLSGLQLYCISKLYNVWFARRLAALLPEHVTCNAVTPGWVPGTALGRGVPWLMRMAYQTLFPLLPFTVSVPEGARRVVAVCVGPLEGAARGGYFSRGAQGHSSPESHDEAAAEALWRLSEAAAGVKSYVQPPPMAAAPALAAEEAEAEATAAGAATTTEGLVEAHKAP